MPRTARLDIPGLLQHVMVRGIERREIFNDDHDRESFVRRLSSLLVETETDCYAWCLMPNHVHLLIRPLRDKLGTFMKRLLTGYAVSHNLRHGRAGHLFQNRYKSIICEEESYLLELVRYIHLNPLRGGVLATLEELDEFQWSGHGVMMGKSGLDGQNVESVLQRFGRSTGQARRLYREFVADGIGMGQRSDLVGIRPPGTVARDDGAVDGEPEPMPFDPRILGSSDFVERVRSHEELRERIDETLSLSALVLRVASKAGLEPEQIIRPSKARLPAAARAVACFLAVNRYRHRGSDVGQFLGLSPAGVTMAMRRADRLAKTDDFVRSLLASEM